MALDETKQAWKEEKEIIITDLWLGEYEIGKDIKSFDELTDKEKKQIYINKEYDEAFDTLEVAKKVRDLLSRPAWTNNGIPDGKEFFHRGWANIRSAGDQIKEKATFIWKYTPYEK